MSRSTPEPILVPSKCEVCRASTPFVRKWEGKRRCRECLRDMLLRAPKGAKRRRLLNLLGPEDWAQGEFDFHEQGDA